MSYMTIQVLDGDQQVMIKALLLSANNRPVSHYDVLTDGEADEMLRAITVQTIRNLNEPDRLALVDLLREILVD